MRFPKMSDRQGGGNGRSVLFVEDDEGYRYALTKRLEDKGFQVTAVADFRDALTAIEGDAPIDVLLCDIRMPQDTPHGFSIARMALVRRPRLRVLFITGFDVPSTDSIPDSKILSKSIGDDVIVLEVEEACAAAQAGRQG
jgi:CheY-like chemotaxis protein